MEFVSKKALTQEESTVCLDTKTIVDQPEKDNGSGAQDQTTIRGSVTFATPLEEYFEYAISLDTIDEIPEPPALECGNTVYEISMYDAEENNFPDWKIPSSLEVTLAKRKHYQASETVLNRDIIQECVKNDELLEEKGPEHSSPLLPTHARSAVAGGDASQQSGVQMEQKVIEESEDEKSLREDAFPLVYREPSELLDTSLDDDITEAAIKRCIDNDDGLTYRCSQEDQILSNMSCYDVSSSPSECLELPGNDKDLLHPEVKQVIACVVQQVMAAISPDENVVMQQECQGGKDSAQIPIKKAIKERQLNGECIENSKSNTDEAEEKNTEEASEKTKDVSPKTTNGAVTENSDRPISLNEAHLSSSHDSTNSQSQVRHVSIPKHQTHLNQHNENVLELDSNVCRNEPLENLSDSKKHGVEKSARDRRKEKDESASPEAVATPVYSNIESICVLDRTVDLPESSPATGRNVESENIEIQCDSDVSVKKLFKPTDNQISESLKQAYGQQKVESMACETNCHVQSVEINMKNDDENAAQEAKKFDLLLSQEDMFDTDAVDDNSDTLILKDMQKNSGEDIVQTKDSDAGLVVFPERRKKIEKSSTNNGGFSQTHIPQLHDNFSASDTSGLHKPNQSHTQDTGDNKIEIDSAPCKHDQIKVAEEYKLPDVEVRQENPKEMAYVSTVLSTTAQIDTVNKDMDSSQTLFQSFPSPGSSQPSPVTLREPLDNGVQLPGSDTNVDTGKEDDLHGIDSGLKTVTLPCTETPYSVTDSPYMASTGLGGTTQGQDIVKPCPQDDVQDIVKPCPQDDVQDIVKPYPQDEAQDIMKPCPQDEAQYIMKPCPQDIVKPCPQDDVQDIVKPYPQDDVQDIMKPCPQDEAQYIMKPCPQDIVKPCPQDDVQDIVKPYPQDDVQDIMKPCPQDEAQYIMKPCPQDIVKPCPQDDAQANTKTPVIEQSYNQDVHLKYGDKDELNVYIGLREIPEGANLSSSTSGHSAAISQVHIPVNAEASIVPNTSEHHNVIQDQQGMALLTPPLKGEADGNETGPEISEPMKLEPTDIELLVEEISQKLDLTMEHLSPVPSQKKRDDEYCTPLSDPLKSDFVKVSVVRSESQSSIICLQSLHDQIPDTETNGTDTRDELSLQKHSLKRRSESQDIVIPTKTQRSENSNQLSQPPHIVCPIDSTDSRREEALSGGLTHIQPTTTNNVVGFASQSPVKEWLVPDVHPMDRKKQLVASPTWREDQAVPDNRQEPVVTLQCHLVEHDSLSLYDDKNTDPKNVTVYELGPNHHDKNIALKPETFHQCRPDSASDNISSSPNSSEGSTRTDSPGHHDHHKVPGSAKSSFRWNYAPSVDFDSASVLQENMIDEDASVEPYRLQPLVTCHRPLRVGLSRRHRGPSLHPNFRPLHRLDDM